MWSERAGGLAATAGTREESPMTRGIFVKLVMCCAGLAVLALACGAVHNAAGTQFNCPDGTPRTKVDCASISSLKGRVVSANLGIPKIGLGFGGSYDEQAIEQISSSTQALAVSLDAQCQQYNACAIDAATWTQNQQRLVQHVNYAEQLTAPNAAVGDAMWANAVPELAAERLSLEYRVETRSASETAFRQHAHGATMMSGDKLRFQIRANRTAHLYILLLSSQGEASQLFPMPGINMVNPLPANAVVTIPDPSSGAVYGLDAVTGKEHIQILASTEPLGDVEQRLAQLQGAPAAGAAQPSSEQLLSSIGDLLCDGDAERTRGIVLTKSSAKCGDVTTRGIQLEQAPAAGRTAGQGAPVGSALNARPNDNVIVYQHEIDHR